MGHAKFAIFVAAFVGSWYLGQLIADAMMERVLWHGFNMIQKIGQKPQARAPSPKRHKCDHWTSCPSGTFAFLVLSGSENAKPPKICFEDKIILSGRKFQDLVPINDKGTVIYPSHEGREKGNFGRGMNIAIVEDLSGQMIEYIKKAPDGSFILMATFDDSSTRLTENAKKYIEELGSKEIQKLSFRGNWVFLGTKGFTLPKDYQREKIINSEKGKNRYNNWPAEIQIDGCFSPKTDYL